MATWSTPSTGDRLDAQESAIVAENVARILRSRRMKPDELGKRTSLRDVNVWKKAIQRASQGETVQLFRVDTQRAASFLGVSFAGLLVRAEPAVPAAAITRPQVPVPAWVTSGPADAQRLPAFREIEDHVLDALLAQGIDERGCIARATDDGTRRMLAEFFSTARRQRDRIVPRSHLVALESVLGVSVDDLRRGVLTVTPAETITTAPDEPSTEPKIEAPKEPPMQTQTETPQVPMVSTVIGEGTEAHRIVHVGEWNLVAFTCDDEPLVPDEEAMRRLGYKSGIVEFRKRIRELMAREGLKFSPQSRKVKQPRSSATGQFLGEHEFTSYLFTARELGIVCTQIHTDNSDAVTVEIVEVWDLARRGLLPGRPSGLSGIDRLAGAIEQLARSHEQDRTEARERFAKIEAEIASVKSAPPHPVVDSVARESIEGVEVVQRKIAADVRRIAPRGPQIPIREWCPGFCDPMQAASRVMHATDKLREAGRRIAGQPVTLESVSAAMGTQHASLRQWYNCAIAGCYARRGTKRSYLKRVADAMGCRAEYLTSGQGPISDGVSV